MTRLTIEHCVEFLFFRVFGFLVALTVLYCGLTTPKDCGDHMRVALFATCIGDTMFPDAAKATALLLTRLGHDMSFRPDRPAAGRCTSTPARPTEPSRT